MSWKILTGIKGFDDLTLGDLRVGGPTLICGVVGPGKSLFALTFIENGAKLFDKPGVFMSFEERAESL